MTTARQQQLDRLNARHRALEALLDDLTKPAYVWRMARSCDGPGQSAIDHGYVQKV